MKKNHLLCKCVFGVFLINLISCTDIDLSDVSKDITLQQSLAIPVGEATVTIGDLFRSLDSWQKNFEFDADTILYITEKNQDYLYSGINMLSNASASTYTVNPQSMVVDANTSITLPNNKGAINLGINGGTTPNRVDSAKISAASLDLKMTVNDLKDLNGNTILPSDIKVKLVFPKMHETGSNTAISKDVTISGFGANNPVILKNFTLDCADIDQIPFEVYLSTGSRKIKIGTNAQINAEIKITQLNYSVAYGIFAPVSVTPTELKVPLESVKNFPSGLRFTSPRINATVTSNIGTYIRFNIDYVKSISKGNTASEASFLGNPFTSEVINAMPAAPDSFAVKSLPEINSAYGGTDKLFNNIETLDEIAYKFSITRDLAQNPTKEKPHFILPEMKLNVYAKIKIPFCFKAGTTATINKSIDVDSAFNDIQQGTLFLKATNSLPAKVSLTMKFLRENGDTIVSSINDSVYVIKGGVVDDKGYVTSATETKLSINLSAAQTAELKNAKTMVYTIRAATQDNKTMTLTKNNYFNLKIGVFAKGKYNITL